MITKRKLAERLAMAEIILNEFDDTLLDLEKRVVKLEKKAKKNDKVSK